MMDGEKRERDQKIRELIAQEIEDGASLAAEARKMVGYLLVEKKGYAKEDIRTGVAFEVKLGDETAWSKLDFVVLVDGKPGMIVKCAAGSLDSRQRQVVAAARVVASPPVPIAVVADPTTALVLDVASGKVAGEDFGAIPVRDQLRTLVAGMKLPPLSPERVEKEKRILLAFDAIQCHVPKGKDGGVRIGPEDCKS